MVYERTYPWKPLDVKKMLDVAGLALIIEKIWPLLRDTGRAHVPLDDGVVADTCEVVRMEDSRINAREASKDVSTIHPQII